MIALLEEFMDIRTPIYHESVTFCDYYFSRVVYDPASNDGGYSPGYPDISRHGSGFKYRLRIMNSKDEVIDRVYGHGAFYVEEGKEAEFKDWYNMHFENGKLDVYCYECIFSWAEGAELGTYRNGFEYGAIGLGEIAIDNIIGYIIGFHTGLLTTFYLQEELVPPNIQ